MTLHPLRRVAGVVVLACAPWIASCYSYIPAEIGRPARGERIRSVVQSRPTFEVGDRIVRDVTRVDGEVIAWRADTLALSATELRSFETSYLGNGYTVYLPVADITSLSVRRLNKRNTTLTALAAAVTFFVVNRTLGGGAKGDDNPPGGGPIH